MNRSVLSGRLGAAGLFLTLLALAAALHAPVLWGGRAYAFVDASRFFYPMLHWGAATWGTGHLPLWNPTVDCGAPYWADPQNACAYPPLWGLFALFPFFLAFHLFVALHQAWAAVGFLAFARSKGASAPASLAGAVAFAFSLHLTCSSWTPVALAALSWIPWIFLGGEALKKGARGGWLGTSIALALQMAAGYPVVAYLTGLCLWATLLPGDGWRGGRWGGAARLAGAYLVAVLYNLSWALPFAEYFTLTNHGRDGAGYFQALSWRDLLSWLRPFPQGNPVGGGYHGIHFWVATFYMGWMVPLLILGRLFFRKGKGAALVLFASALWLSLGETAVLGGWLKHLLPGYGLVIRSGFWIGPTVFFAAVLAVEGLDDLASRWGGGTGWMGWVLALLTAFSLLPSVWAVRFTLPASYYLDPPKALASLGEEGRYLHSPKVLENAGWLEGPDADAAYQTPKERLYPDWPMIWGASSVVGYNTIGFRGFRQWRDGVFTVSPGLSRSALDFLRVRYLFGKNTFGDFARVADAGGIPVYKNTRSLPIWSCAGEVRSSRGMREDWETLSGEKKGFGDLAFVEGWGEPARLARRDIGEKSDGPNAWALRLAPGGKALLVSSETAAPGWIARVDGTPRAPVVVHGTFRGLILEPGDQSVRWVYEPATFRLGAFLGLLAVGCWAALGAAVALFRRG